MPAHAYFARPGVRKWISRNKRSRGDVLVFVVALVLLALFAGGML